MHQFACRHCGEDSAANKATVMVTPPYAFWPVSKLLMSFHVLRIMLWSSSMVVSTLARHSHVGDCEETCSWRSWFIEILKHLGEFMDDTDHRSPYIGQLGQHKKSHRRFSKDTPDSFRRLAHICYALVVYCRVSLRFQLRSDSQIHSQFSRPKA